MKALPPKIILTLFVINFFFNRRIFTKLFVFTCITSTIFCYPFFFFFVSTISLCLYYPYKFFTVNFIHSDLSFICAGSFFSIALSHFISFYASHFLRISYNVCQCLLLSFSFVFPFANFFTFNCSNLLFAILIQQPLQLFSAICFDSSVRFVLF